MSATTLSNAPFSNALYGAEDDFPKQDGLAPQAFKVFSYERGGQRIPLKWNQPNGKGSAIDISYAFDKGASYSGLSVDRVKSLFSKALGVWSQYAPLNFKEIADPGRDDAVDIRVKSNNIDGRGNTVGFAYSPSRGDITFDRSEQWNESFFLETAVHEIGHALGLAHEGGVDAVMNPSLKGRYSDSPFLLQDDINGIRSLYGSGKGSVSTLAGGSPGPAPKPPAPTSSPVPKEPVPETTPNIEKNLVLNGGFENSSVRANSYGFFRQLEGWQLDSGRAIQIERRTNQLGAAAEGGAWLELDSLGNSTVSQRIDTVNGADYKLSFAYSPRDGYGADTNGVEVLWDGEKLDTITAAGRGKNSWKTFSYDVEGKDISRLAFRGTGTSDNFGGFIDKVALVGPAPMQMGATDSGDECWTDAGGLMTHGRGEMTAVCGGTSPLTTV